MPLRPGDTFHFKGQSYRCVGVQEHVRRDGLPTELADVERVCPECGSAFRLTLPVDPAPAYSPTRRCPKHRKPGRPVRKPIAS